MSAPPPPLVLDTSSPPIVPLVAGEQLLHCHQVEYADRVGLAWLTSQRVLLRADRPTPLLQAKISAPTTSPEERANMQQPQQFTLPLASIAGQIRKDAAQQETHAADCAVDSCEGSPVAALLYPRSCGVQATRCLLPPLPR